MTALPNGRLQVHLDFGANLASLELMRHLGVSYRSALLAYFSDRGRPFQSDRGRRFSVIVDGRERRTSSGLNVSQSSTISLKRPSAAPASGPVLGLD